MKKRKFNARRGAACLVLAAAALFFCGMYKGDQVLVEDTHIVQSGETLWSISETYLQKNTGGRRYIMEFMEGIKELNPWIKEQGYTIHPGDKVRVNYWVKKAEDGQHGRH